MSKEKITKKYKRELKERLLDLSQKVNCDLYEYTIIHLENNNEVQDVINYIDKKEWSNPFRICKYAENIAKAKLPKGWISYVDDCPPEVSHPEIYDLNDINFIFCNHPLKKNEVDEDYKEEYLEACKRFKCALFSFEDIENNKLSLYGDHIEGLTIYRGWMMSPKIYAIFYKKLFENNIILINDPAEYGRYHMLPCWYDDFKELTPESILILSNLVDIFILLNY